MLVKFRSSAVFIFTLYTLTYCAAFVTTKPSTVVGNNNEGPRSANMAEAGVAFLTNGRYQRSIYGLGPKMLAISHSKIPIELDLLVDDLDEDEDGRPKRYDDYGHMRFGKRGGGKFDDYGHMRFGRSV